MYKRSSPDTGISRKSARLNIVDVFPSSCYFCKNVKKRVGDKRESCHVLTKVKTESVLHKAICFHKDRDLLVYIDNNASLLERKFQMHKSCYRTYVKPIYSSSSLVEQPQDDNEDNGAEDGITTEQSTIGQESNRFDIVSDYIKEHVVNSKESSISMSYLHEMYSDGHAGDCRFRGKLKAKIIETFGDKVRFVSESKKAPEIIVNGDASAMTSTSKRNVVNLAADYIRQDILHMSSTVSRTSWPPSKDELQRIEESIPDSITSFYKRILHPGTKHEIPDSTKVLVNSFSSDLVYNVSKGDILPKKHFYLAMGLHNMTGQKAPVSIVSNLGHCDSYDNVCINETAQALLAQEDLKTGKHLKIQPREGSFVNTIYWADNFNMAHDTMGDSAFIDITNVVAFQEVNAGSFAKVGSKSALSKQECKISQLEVISVDDVFVNKRLQPQSIINTISDFDTQPTHLTKWRIYWWMFLRLLSANDQSFPSLSGWLMLLRSGLKTSINKTEETYLPPLPTSIVDFGTLQKLFEILQDNAKSVNMPIVNLTLDVGAAINAYKLLWNYPSKFSNIMIHLGDFHFMKENFGVIGLLIKNSGFEDIVFQSRLCTSGCLNGILSGGHYNRCWGVHSCFYEALERLLFTFFQQTYEIDPPKEFQPYVEGEPIVPEIFSLPAVKAFFQKYEAFKQEIRNGAYGKTAQFWMVYYIDIMFNQHVMHTAVQENHFENRLHSWKFMLSYFFATNKTNYSRYGAYYVSSLYNIDELYPGNKDLLKESGLSIQSQARYDLRTPVDQRGEQTVNREGKVSGGLKLLRPDDKVMLKWILNRPMQAENTSELKIYANVKGSEEVYKHVRPSQVIASEKCVQRVLDVLQNEYLNPFDPSLDKHRLYNLSSGVPVPNETDDAILSVLSCGQVAYKEFVTTRMQNDGHVSIHDPIKRIKYASFSSTSNTVTVVKCGKEKTIESNRDVIGQLIATSMKYNLPIDFKKALDYQLTAVPLSLAHPDGGRRTTSKNVLIDVIKESNESLCCLPSSNEVSAYVVDLIALARTITAEALPETFKEFFDVLLGKIPTGYQRVDIIVDVYLEKSFKNEERIKRGVGEKVIVASEYSKLPRNFKGFLSNGDNKSRLTELLLKVLLIDRTKILLSLSSEVIYVSTYKKCIRVSLEGSSEAHHLSSNQEEADTKLMLHANDALSAGGNNKVIIRSHSGDTDILIIAIGLFIEDAHRVVIDSNTGKDRLIINLGNVNMLNQQKRCLIPLHALSGNDYTSSFFRRSKLRFWNTLQSNNKFFEVLPALGNFWEVPEEVYGAIEEYICFVYGRRTTKVNEVRYSMFQSKLKKGGKVIDLSILPPCQTVLRLLIQRTNMVARIWKVCKEQPVLPQLYGPDHAWDDNCCQKWSEVIFPDDVTDLLIDVDLESYNASDDVCSDEEDEV